MFEVAGNPVELPQERRKGGVVLFGENVENGSKLDDGKILLRKIHFGSSFRFWFHSKNDNMAVQ